MIQRQTVSSAAIQTRLQQSIVKIEAKIKKSRSNARKFFGVLSVGQFAGSVWSVVREYTSNAIGNYRSTPINGNSTLTCADVYPLVQPSGNGPDALRPVVMSSSGRDTNYQCEPNSNTPEPCYSILNQGCNRMTGVGLVVGSSLAAMVALSAHRLSVPIICKGDYEDVYATAADAGVDAGELKAAETFNSLLKLLKDRDAEISRAGIFAPAVVSQASAESKDIAVNVIKPLETEEAPVETIRSPLLQS